MRVSDKYVFFWQGFIGNWFKSPIIEVIDEYPYHFLNVEQYFMYMKARTFGDEEQCKIMVEIHQKFIETTGIPMNRLQIDLANTEGDIGTETVWYGNKIVDNKKIKLKYNDKG